MFAFIRTRRSVYAIRLCAFMFENRDEKKKIFRSIIIACCVCVGEWFSYSYAVEIVHCVGEKSPFAFFFRPSENLIFNFPQLITRHFRNIYLNSKSEGD